MYNMDYSETMDSQDPEVYNDKRQKCCAFYCCRHSFSILRIITAIRRRCLHLTSLSDEEAFATCFTSTPLVNIAKRKAKEMEFLQLIPQQQLSSEQNTLLSLINEESSSEDGNHLPIYRLDQEPTHLHELLSCNCTKFCIWRDNQTVIVVEVAFTRSIYVPSTSWLIQQTYPHSTRFFSIMGFNETAIAETATFVLSLQNSEPDSMQFNFDVDSIREDQMDSFLDVNPQRVWEFEFQTWTVEQSIRMATRPGPLKIHLYTPSTIHGGFSFTDGGTAFVDALQQRTSIFGSLCLHFNRRNPFTTENYVRLLQLERVVEKLELYMFRPDALLPFQAQVHSLNYRIDDYEMEKTDFETLPIVAKELTLSIHITRTENWSDSIVTFLDRVAQLGHFEHLGLEIDLWHEVDYTQMAWIAAAIVRVLQNNPSMVSLDLSKNRYAVEYTPYLTILFQAMEGHPNLRTFRVNSGKMTVVHFASLERLLFRNRRVTVVNHRDERVTDGTTIDQVYTLNQFFHESKELIQECCSSWRSRVMKTVLMESASANFQRTALLLSDHTDVLCELVNGTNDDALLPYDPTSIIHATPLKKKKLGPNSGHVMPVAAHIEAESSLLLSVNDVINEREIDLDDILDDDAFYE